MTNRLNGKKSIRLILHPGHCKCGSSSIQSFIYSNVEQLKALKIYVPDANFRFSFEEKESSSSFIWNFAFQYLWKFIYDEEKITVFKERVETVLKQAHKKVIVKPYFYHQKI